MQLVARALSRALANTGKRIAAIIAIIAITTSNSIRVNPVFAILFFDLGFIVFSFCATKLC